jgi:DNA polymerase III subunit epsilon
VRLRLDAADRLVRRVAEHGALSVDDAARSLLALVGGPTTLPRGVLDEIVQHDARLLCRAGAVSLAPSPDAAVRLGEARFAVVDLETTGFAVARGRICEIGAVLVERGSIAAEFENDGRVGEFLAFAGDAVLAGHNLRFDLAFLDRELRWSRGARIAAPTVDTLVLARRLLSGRIERANLNALAELFGTSERPCHRALPDARATAEILLRLVELAEERGARTVGDLCALARPRAPRKPIRPAR